MPFEFALVQDDSLYHFANYADAYTFAEQFQLCPDNPYASVFANLGGDATLVIPKNDGGDKNRYGHLAAFLRRAPVQQVAAVWKTAAETYGKQPTESSQAIWFSTAGGGVRWLHFRLDQRPKYYRYNAFRQSS